MARFIPHRLWRRCGLVGPILLLSLVGLAPSGRVRALSHSPRWVEQGPLIPAGRDPYLPNAVGASVALSGDTALVSASSPDVGPPEVGVFVRRGTTWTQQAALTANAEAFGDALALSGDTALVGAARVSNVYSPVYVFVRRGATWTQQAALRARETAIHDLFGDAVALSGDSALIGAPKKNDDDGAAYVFVRR
jgi:hypothetical protein